MTGPSSAPYFEGEAGDAPGLVAVAAMGITLCEARSEMPQEYRGVVALDADADSSEREISVSGKVRIHRDGIMYSNMVPVHERARDVRRPGHGSDRAGTRIAGGCLPWRRR